MDRRQVYYALQRDLLELRAQKWEIKKERVMQRHILERMIRASGIIYPALLEGLKSTNSMMERQILREQPEPALLSNDDDHDIDSPMMNEEDGLMMEEEIHDDIPISFSSIPREELIVKDDMSPSIDDNDRNINIPSPEPIGSPMKKKNDEKREDDEIHHHHRSGSRATMQTKKKSSSSQVSAADDILPKKRASRAKTKSMDIRPKTTKTQTIREEPENQQQSGQASPEALRRSSRKSVSPVRLLQAAAVATPEVEKKLCHKKRSPSPLLRSPSPLIPLPMTRSIPATVKPQARGGGPKRRKPTTTTTAPLSSSAFSNFVNHNVAMIPALKPNAKQQPRSKRK